MPKNPVLINCHFCEERNTEKHLALEHSNYYPRTFLCTYDFKKFLLFIELKLMLNDKQSLL